MEAGRWILVAVVSAPRSSDSNLSRSAWKFASRLIRAYVARRVQASCPPVGERNTCLHVAVAVSGMHDAPRTSRWTTRSHAIELARSWGPHHPRRTTARRATDASPLPHRLGELKPPPAVEAPIGEHAPGPGATASCNNRWRKQRTLTMSRFRRVVLQFADRTVSGPPQTRGVNICGER